MSVKELIIELLNKTEMDNEVFIKVKGYDEELDIKEIKNINGYELTWLEVE